MKPLFATDITTNKNNETPNGEEFISRKPSEMYESALKKAEGSADKMEKRTSLPLPLSILMTACEFAFLILSVSLIRAFLEVGMRASYKNASWVFYVDALCGLGFLALFLIKRKRAKAVLSSDEYKSTVSSLKAVSDGIFAELGAPSDAVSVDVLAFMYKNDKKTGELKIINLGLFTFMPLEMKAFVEDGCLHLVNLEARYSFKLSSLTGIKKIAKRSKLGCWNKDVHFNEGEYKKYNLVSDKYDVIHFKDYYILTLFENGEELGIYFPCYELDTLTRLASLSVSESDL